MKKYDNNGDYILVVCPNPSVDIFAWVDEIKTGGVNRVTKEEHFPGGKGVHVALAAAELGQEVKLLGFWGGRTGSWIKSECERRFENLKCIGPNVGGWARSCYTFKAESDFDDTEILGLGPEITDEDIEAFYHAFDGFVPEATCVVMSGSWPKKAPKDGYANLIGRANAYHKAVILDCTGIQFENAMRLSPYAVHLNKSEAESITKIDDVTASSAKLGKKVLAAITDGAKGLYLSDDQETVHASCKVVEVHSAVGSGDCLSAGLAVAFTLGMSLVDTAKYAVACGGANCMRKDLGLLFKVHVDYLLPTVEIHSEIRHYEELNH